MAKPIIKFRGIKYQIGTNVGYRPQLETAAKRSDLALADEICIEKRLSMSPEELLHAIRTTLTTVPQLVASDGRVREFSGLLSYNRSATGNIDGIGGAWNDTCRARVTAKIMKDAKADIDGTFVNEMSLPTPKVDNIIYNGSFQRDVIQQGNPFTAYGRNLQFNATLGDYAKMLIQTAEVVQEYNLTCTASDVTSCTFSWPSQVPTLESGRQVTILISSRGGVAEAAATVNKRSVLVINAPSPTHICETSDGQWYVDTCKDGNGNPHTGTINLNDKIYLVGDGYNGDWALNQVELVIGSNNYMLDYEVQTGQKIKLEKSGTVPAGTHTNCGLKIEIMNNITMDIETLEIPIANLSV